MVLGAERLRTDETVDESGAGGLVHTLQNVHLRQGEHAHAAVPASQRERRPVESRTGVAPPSPADDAAVKNVYDPPAGLERHRPVAPPVLDVRLPEVQGVPGWRPGASRLESGGARILGLHEHAEVVPRAKGHVELQPSQSESVLTRRILARAKPVLAAHPELGSEVVPTLLCVAGRARILLNRLRHGADHRAQEDQRSQNGLHRQHSCVTGDARWPEGDDTEGADPAAPAGAIRALDRMRIASLSVANPQYRGMIDTQRVPRSNGPAIQGDGHPWRAAVSPPPASRSRRSKRRGRPPAGCRHGPRASSCACPPSAARAACACA